MKKPVAVIDNESAHKPGERLKVLRRFHTISAAESWVAGLSDTAKLNRGGYGIDAPENMLNGKNRESSNG